MPDEKSSRPGCRDCPIDCRNNRGGKNKARLDGYARLWSLDPDEPGLAGLVAEYHRRCNDIGLEVFETALAIALAQQAGAVAGGPQAVLGALEEVSQGTGLGRAIGSGSAAARYFGLDGPLPAGQKKHDVHSPAEDAFLDTAGLCAPAWPGLADNLLAWEALAEMLRAKNGHDFTAEGLNALGREVIGQEERWNREAWEGKKAKLCLI